MHIRHIALVLVVAHSMLVFGCGYGDGTEDENICACMDRYRSDSYSGPAIESLESALCNCFDCEENLLFGETCLPHAMGTDVRNNQILEVVYFCSDVCPTYGRVYIRYQDVEEVDCENIGGQVERDPAWGSYMGCVPPEQPMCRYSSIGCEL